MTNEGKVTVLLSGKGSNLKALIQQQSGYRIGHVISDRADAGGLELAREARIPTSVVTRAEFSSLPDFKGAILEAVQRTEPSLVALAGFMVLVQPEFVEAYHGRLLNIHPALLPKFPGLNTHARALEAGEPEHGCTVHFVDTGVDTGPLIAQASLPVLVDDTPDTLAARVVEQEHALYPWVVRCAVRGEIRLEGSRVLYSDTIRAEAQALGFTIFS
jgi:phosphoribosylglycinamide formyltransferase-1